jgi:NADP-dependent 3-hydroxy acid dehydrogenase YdfG
MSASSSSDAKPLGGKVAVVTGASGGIGAGAFSPSRKARHHSRRSNRLV